MSKGIFLSQRKYSLDLLRETCIHGCLPVATTIEQNHRLGNDMGTPIDRELYKRLVEKTDMYLSRTHPDLHSL
jgi:hypothetical protein